MTAVGVWIDSSAGAVPVGVARITRRRGVETTEFTYDDAYLAGPGWAISPDLPTTGGRLVVAGLPGALGDSAPDAWGRNLITRQLASRARDARQQAPTPTEGDFLLGVNDVTRQGALRIRLDDDQPFLADGGGVAALLELEALLEATRQVTADPDADDAVVALLAAGSGSIGGARPKASVIDGTTLHIAKFPHRDDRWDVMRWEAVALDLADASGLQTPAHRLVEIGGDAVLLVERFDRAGDRRIPYLSGRSLVGARDSGTSDYLELVDGLTEHGSDVRADLDELWRRIAFSLLINNTDDHVRNHGFLRDRAGWKLSPVFDVNPDPRPGIGRATSIAGATTAAECRRSLFAEAARFGLSPGDANERWHDLAAATSRWREVTSANGISEVAQREFASALDRWST